MGDDNDVVRLLLAGNVKDMTKTVSWWSSFYNALYNKIPVYRSAYFSN